MVASLLHPCPASTVFGGVDVLKIIGDILDRVPVSDDRDKSGVLISDDTSEYRHYRNRR